MKKTVILIAILCYINSAIFSQNVGIGTITPAAKLDLRHTSSLSSPTLLLYDNDLNNYSRLQFQNASGNKFWHVAGFINNTTDANSRLNFFHSVAGDVLSLTGDKKVGIGIGNPEYSLDVLGRIRVKTGITGNIFTTSGIWLEDYRDGNNRIFFGMQDSIRLGIWGEGSPGAAWGFNFNARNGYVGIGTIASTDKLEVNGNIKADNFNYSGPKPDFLSMGGADFRAINSNDQTFAMFSVPGVYMLNGTNGIVAPVHLPEGAVVTALLVYVYDNSATENLIVNLFSGDHVGIAGGMATVSSSGVPGNTLLLDNTISNPDISNTAEYYYIHAASSTGTWTDFNLRVTRIQINYTVNSPR